MNSKKSCREDNNRLIPASWLNIYLSAQWCPPDKKIRRNVQGVCAVTKTESILSLKDALLTYIIVYDESNNMGKIK